MRFEVLWIQVQEFIIIILIIKINHCGKCSCHERIDWLGSSGDATVANTTWLRGLSAAWCASMHDGWWANPGRNPSPDEIPLM